MYYFEPSLEHIENKWPLPRGLIQIYRSIQKVSSIRFSKESNPNSFEVSKVRVNFQKSNEKDPVIHESSRLLFRQSFEHFKIKFINKSL